MYNKKILTVSIAAYNVEKYIEQCLNSFINEEIIDKLEILVIDDGGTDSTNEIANRYVEEFPNTFKLIHKDNGGWGSTLNTGFKYASGKYFKQLDGDDYFNPDSLKEFVEYLEYADEDLIITKVRTFDDITGEIIDETEYNSNVVVEKTVSLKEAAEMVRIIMHTCTFKTAIYVNNRINITEKCFYTDQEYFIKSMAFVKDVVVLDKTVYCYRLGREGQSVSVTGLLKHYKDNFSVIDSLMKFEKEIENCDNKEIVHEYILKYLIGIYYRLIDLNLRKELIRFDKKVRNNYSIYKKELPIRISFYRLFRFIGAKRILK